MFHTPINDNLEDTIQTIFKAYFINYDAQEGASYEDFEFGKYPSDWDLVTMDKIVDVRDGTHDSPVQTAVGHPLITSKHLLPYSLNKDDAYFISEADFKKANERSKVECGDILFSMIGTIGQISLITEKDIDFAIKNVGLFRTSQNPEIRYYILSYLKSSIVNNYIASFMLGSTQSYVSLNALRSIPLILPDKNVLLDFESKVSPIYKHLIENEAESNKLSNLLSLVTASISSR